MHIELNSVSSKHASSNETTQQVARQISRTGKFKETVF